MNACKDRKTYIYILIYIYICIYINKYINIESGILQMSRVRPTCGLAFGEPDKAVP